MTTSAIQKNNHSHYGLINSISLTTSSAVYFIYYTAISYITSFCDSKKSHRYDLLSEYYYKQLDTIDAYWHFGSDLIYPAVNIERVNKLIRPLNNVKIDQLFNRTLQNLPPSISLNKNLFPRKKITSGVCLSFSINFIAQYSELIKRYSTEEAVYHLGSKFQTGSSEKTGIIHGFQKARGFTSEWWKSSDISLDFYRALAATYGGLSFESSQLSMGTFAGSSTPSQGALTRSSISEKLPLLRNGAYLVIQDPSPSKEKQTGHAIVYIRGDTQNYLFDPALGTVKISKGLDAEYLLKSMGNAECDDGGIKFYRALPRN